MRLHRRFVIAGGLAATVLPRASWSGTRVEFDGLQVDTLLDGRFTLPASLLYGQMDPAIAAPILAQSEMSSETVERPCNVTLMRSSDRTVLFDMGAGTGFLSGTGKLPGALDALGVDPSEITDVVFTHAHPDHLWGLTDDFDDLLLPDASYHMGAAEFAFWSDPATVASLPESQQSFAVGAASRLERIAGALNLLNDGDTVVPGVTAHATHGHTPGHMSFRIGTESEGIMVIGDAIADHHIAFAAPAQPSGTDMAPEQAAETRKALLEMLAESAMLLIGYHLPDGGVGRVEREENAYRFAPQ